MTRSATPPGAPGFAVHVYKENLKFSAGHFMAYPGFREALHGHNYQVSVRVSGALGQDGYVLDFGHVKRAARQICEALDERVILPEESDCLELAVSDAAVDVRCEDGSRFSFPRSDVVLLPLVHSSAEELAAYIHARLLAELPELSGRAVERVEVGVGEAPGQFAYFDGEASGR